MIETNKIEETKVIEYEIAVICDVCKKRYTPDDVFEYQEIVSVRKRTGYGSRFGDDYDISIDICDECMFKMFKDNIVYKEDIDE